MSFLCVSLRSFLVCMLCWVKDIDRELEEQGSLEDHGHPLVEGWREGDKNAGLVEVSSILIPTFSLFVSMLANRADFAPPWT
jgi:hypothetical protein